MKFALIAAVAARHHHHHHETQLLETMEAYEAMNEDQLLVSLESKLSQAQSLEARGDGDAAVAKTAAIKNIQKALTARIQLLFRSSRAPSGVSPLWGLYNKPESLQKRCRG